MPPEAVEPSPAGSSRTGRLVPGLLVLVAASLAFCLSLLANMPASRAAQYLALPPQFNHISGTVWRGAATVAGATSVTWRIDAKATIARRAVVLPVVIEGPGTDLRGSLVVGLRTGGVDGLRGPVSWRIVEALMPGLEIICDLSADLIDFSATGIPLRPGTASIPRATGAAEVAAGTCQRLDGRFGTVPVPPLVVQIDPKDGGSLARVTTAEAPDVPLADAELTGAGHVIVTVHPAGARRVPGMPASSATTLEFPLSAFLP